MVVFQSTLSSRRATGRCGERGCIPFHFNPRSPHGERLSPISRLPARDPNFNPRSPHGERPAPPLMRTLNHRTFQSTLSSRRATADMPKHDYDRHPFQSTLSSRRATTRVALPWFTVTDFNPRSPHGERLANSVADAATIRFQSTLSSRRATIRLLEADQGIDISIHALLTESDRSPVPGHPRPWHFNPRSPHGERPPDGFALSA